MLRPLVRIGLSGVLVIASMPIIGGVALADCAHNERIGGECSAVTTQTNDQDVTISASVTTEGAPGSDASSTAGGAAYGGYEPPPIRLEAELGSSECEVKVAGLCRGSAPAKQEAIESTVSVPPQAPTHVSELATFRPTRPGIVIEPDGWALPTLDVNVYSTASRHRVSGELLGWPVVIRFTPARFRWSFGDGHSATYSSAGSSNASAGRDQFDRSPTSHAYLRPGSYTLRLVVDYDVEFKFEGGTFSDIDGQVSRDASTRVINVFRVAPLLLGE